MLFGVILLLAAFCIISVVKMRAMKIELVNARKSDNMKSAFLTKFNNEIRTPINGVSGLAGMLSRDDLYLSKSEKKSISAQILHNINIISTLIEECMVFSHGGGGHYIEKESFNPNMLCMKCIDALQHDSIRQERPNVSINFKKQVSDDFFVRTDPHIVELIINKLLYNACKFTKEGEITVGCNVTENIDKLTFYVQDTGAGIPKDRMGNIFNWFERPEETKDDAEIDLSIAQRLAMKLGGIIRIDEGYTKGTRVSFILAGV